MDSWDEEVRRFMLEEEEDDDELFLVLVPALQLAIYDEKEPEHTSILTGPKYVKEGIFSLVAVIKLLYSYSVQLYFGVACTCSCLHGSMDDIAIAVHAFNLNA
jgi:hypothetical protein